MLKAFQNIGIKTFGIVTCKKLEHMYDEQGSCIIDKYSECKLDGVKREHGWAFDDLGYESMGKHYGKELNVLEDVLELINTRKTWRVMHATSNLSSAQLKEKYGDRIFSRMRMMFNFISYDPKSKDMRE